MALIRFENGHTTGDMAEISGILDLIGVSLKFWPVADSVSELLKSQVLDDAQKAEVLKAHESYFQQLKKSDGYQTQDIIVLHAEMPGLDDNLAKFFRIHTHDDDEVRYIVDGEGVFGFVMPDNSQIELTVSAGDYINVPANTEHWFRLTDKKRIKAIRYFTSQEGWAPVYTDRSMAQFA